MAEKKSEQFMSELSKRFDEQSKDARELRLLNVEHKRNYLNGQGTLVVAELAGLITLKTTEIDVNLLWLFSFLVLLLNLVYTQMYIFLILLFEGKQVDLFESKVSPIHNEFLNEIEKLGAQGKSLTEIEFHLFEITPSIYEKHLPKKTVLNSFSKLIGSDCFFAINTILFFIGSFSLIFSINFFWDLIWSFPN